VKKHTFLLVFFIALGIFMPFASIAQQKQTPPRSNELVNDYAGLINDGQQRQLEAKLVAYDRETSTQIAIVIEKSLEGDDPFSYAQRLASSWGIGGREHSNGLLIYISEQDRQIRIQTGYGAEGFLPDVTAKRIIENVLKPAFRNQNYYEGLDRATDIIIGLAKGEGYEGNENYGNNQEIPGWLIILLFIIIIIIISSFSNHDDGDDGGYYRGGRYDIPHRRGRGFPGGFGGGFSGGGFGGGGGGGFGGFGGGGFGGGGAGGGW